jgi:hypothetical protein
VSMFSKATKTKAKLRLALAGPAGSGKTYSALALASIIADGGKIAVIDTENGSASKYADLFSFDAADLTVGTGFSPERYLDLLHAAEDEGYAVIAIDSLSHEWAGQDGILQAVDQAAARVSGNKFVAWGQVTPRHDKLVRAIVESPAHIICTLRAKMEYVQERNDRGRTEIRAVGMKPIQRDELEYEFDVYGLLDQDNRLVVRKSRCPALNGAVIEKPGEDVGAVLMGWLNNGSETLPVSSIQGVPLSPATCDAAFFNRRWHAAVKDTRFADEETRHKFVGWFTQRRYTSLPAFLETASTDEANRLIVTVEEAIQREARKVTAS